jgi:hypothetical protein
MKEYPDSELVELEMKQRGAASATTDEPSSAGFEQRVEKLAEQRANEKLRAMIEKIVKHLEKTIS